MKRFFKLAAVVAGVLGLVATSAPPAHSVTILASVFTGAATLAGPLGYPVLNGTPDVPTTDCALPLTGELAALPNCHVHWGGNTRAITGLGSTACANVAVNVTKANKDAVDTSAACGFNILASTKNVVSGFCGLSGGQARVTYNDGTGQTFTLDTHFNGIASVLILTGHATKVGSTQTGLVVGATLAIPPNAVTGGGSCLDKTATTFTLVGAAVAVGL